MVVNSIEAFVTRDIEQAEQVTAKDDEIDQLFADARSALIEMIQKETIKPEVAVDLLMVAKYFERIGDHATNIAEWRDLLH